MKAFHAISKSSVHNYLKSLVTLPAKSATLKLFEIFFLRKESEIDENRTSVRLQASKKEVALGKNEMLAS